MSRLAYAAGLCLLVIMFLSGGILGSYVASRDLNENTEAIDKLDETQDDLSTLLRRQTEGSERGRLIAEGVVCLLRALTPPPGEDVPDRLSPELCPEVDFDALFATPTTTTPEG